MAKCVKCGKKVCPRECKFYMRLGGWLCKDCQKYYMLKNIVKENLKKVPNNLKLSIG